MPRAVVRREGEHERLGVHCGTLTVGRSLWDAAATKGPKARKVQVPEGGSMYCTSPTPQGLNPHAWHTRDLVCTDCYSPICLTNQQLIGIS